MSTYTAEVRSSTGAVLATVPIEVSASGIPGNPRVVPNLGIAWDAVPNATGYKCYDTTRSGSAWTPILPASTRSYNVANPPVGGTAYVGWTPAFTPPHPGEDWITPELQVSFGGTPPPPPPPVGTGKMLLGAVANSDHGNAITNAAKVGAGFLRMEFGNGQSAESVKAEVDAARAKGLQVLVQCENPWDNLGERVDPVTGQHYGIVSWGKAMGTSIIGLEFSNEDNMEYKGATFARGVTYGANYKAVHFGLAGACPLFAQGDDPHGVNWPEAVKSTAGTVDGWTVHPYGPQSRAKPMLDGVMNDTTGPVLVTEWGLATDNGNNLNNNYGWPTNQTYAQAAAAMEQSIAWMASAYPRITHFALFQTHDRRPSGTGERENYFGIVKNDGSEKGPYTAKYRELAARYKG